ncbi:MAG TPA: hypothetical protein VFI43_10040 [Nitrosospira sp.]|nr:hypothetical protein [Nitrosospira sp.]
MTSVEQQAVKAVAEQTMAGEIPMRINDFQEQQMMQAVRTCGYDKKGQLDL